MTSAAPARLPLAWAPVPQIPWDVGIDLTAGLGFEGFDLLMVGNLQAVRLDELLSDVAGWADLIGNRVRDRGLVVSDVFGIPDGDLGELAPNHPDSEERRYSREFFGHMLELTAQLGCPGMSQMPGLHWPEEAHEESFERAVHELGWRAARAQERGVRFSIEPHNGSLCRSPAEAVQLCERTPGLEITLDYSHFTSMGFSDAQIEPLLDHTRHIHLRGGADGWLQAPLRDSTIDWERAVDAMHERGYQGYLTLEYISGELDERMREVDVMAETILLRDRIAAKLAGTPWTQPVGP